MLVLLSSLILHAVAAPPAKERIVILEAQLVGLPKEQTSLVTSMVAAAFAGRSEADPVTFAEIDNLLSIQRDRYELGCGEDAACMTAIAEATKVRLALSSTVGSLGRSLVVTLVLLDTRSARTLGRASETVPNLQRLPVVLPGLLDQLLGKHTTAAGPRYTLPRGQPLSVAVFALEPSGVTAEVARSVTQVLATQIKQIKGTTVISSEDIDAMLALQKQKLELGCVDDVVCMANIGGALGVDKLVLGNVGKLANEHIVSLRLVDAKAVRVDNRVIESFSGGAEQLIPAVRFAARQLFGVASNEPGAILVVTDQPAAEVYVNEKSRGRTPLPAIGNLPAGRQSLRLAKDGYAPWHSDVYVDPGTTMTVRLELEELPAWYKNPWIWTAAAAVIAGGAAVWYVTRQPEASPAAPPDTQLGTFPL